MAARATEPGVTPLENLRYLAAKTATVSTLAQCSALSRLVCIGLEVPDDLPEGIKITLVQKALEGTTRRARETVLGSLRPGGHTGNAVDQYIAAAGELIGFTDEAMLTRIYKARREPQPLPGQDTKRHRQERAGIWLDRKSKTADRQENELLKALEAALKVFIGDPEIRAALSNDLAGRIGNSPPSPAQQPSLFDRSFRNVPKRIATGEETSTLHNLEKSVERKAADFLTSTRSGHYNFDVRWSPVQKDWTSEDAVLAGRLGRSPAELPATIPELAEYLCNTPQARIAILGEGGAGKSTLAAKVARQMVARRQGSGGAVPVILEVSKWRDGDFADNWLIEQLETLPESLGLKQDSGSGVSWAEDLLKRSWIFPILDGFDELPRSRRQAVLRSLNLGDSNRGFLLLSRTGEYRKASQDSQTLLDAAVLQLNSLSEDEIRKVLRESGAAWIPVLADLDHPNATGQVLLEALSLPLILVLAGEIYKRKSRQPVELVQLANSGGVKAVRDKILDDFVEVKYERGAHDPRRHGKSYPATEARRWLGFLAANLMVQDTADFVWWKRKAYGFFTPIITTIGFAITLGMVSAATLYFARSGPAWIKNAAASTLLAGFLAPFLLVQSETAMPRALSRKPGIGPLRDQLDLLPWIAVVAGVIAAYGMAGPVMGTCSVPLLAASLLWTPVAETETRDPRSILRDDILAGVVRFGVSGVGSVLVAVGIWLVTGDWRILSYMPVALAAAVILALASSFTSWQVMATGLARQGLAPRDGYMRFLAQAHEKEVLRRAEGAYQFRHAILQEYLARRYMEDSGRQEVKDPIWQSRLFAFLGRSGELSSEAVCERLHRLIDENSDNPPVATEIWRRLVEVLLDMGLPEDALGELCKLKEYEDDSKTGAGYHSAILYILILKEMGPEDRTRAAKKLKDLKKDLERDEKSLRMKRMEAAREAREELHVRGL